MNPTVWYLLIEMAATIISPGQKQPMMGPMSRETCASLRDNIRRIDGVMAAECRPQIGFQVCGGVSGSTFPCPLLGEPERLE